MFLPRGLALLPLLVLAALSGCDQPDTQQPTETPAATAAIEDQYALDTIALVAERMQQLRGLDGGSGPEVSLLDEAGLAELVDELLMQPDWRESLEHDQRLYTLLGLIPPETDLTKLSREMANLGIAGLYRPELDRYYLRMFGEYSSLEESTSSHEYAHYLQDHHFNLETMLEPANINRDRQFAVRALVEGEATYLQAQYVDQYFNSVQLFGLTFGGLLAAAETPAVPLALTREAQFVYLEGLNFVRGLLRSGIEADELFERPPSSTEQVLHPEKYRANEVAEDVSPFLGTIALPAGWSLTARDVLGEFQLRTWLQEVGAGFDADEAAAGWGGDAYQLLTTASGGDALLARIHWDAPADADEFSTVVVSALNDDERYEPLECVSCAYSSWRGPAGVLALWRTEAGGPDGTLLAVAPAEADLVALLNSAR